MISTYTSNSKIMEDSYYNDSGNCKSIIYLNHQLVKNNQILETEKLIPKELYSLFIVLKNELPSS